jgi:hypothetical protein
MKLNKSLFVVLAMSLFGSAALADANTDSALGKLSLTVVVQKLGQAIYKGGKIPQDIFKVAIGVISNAQQGNGKIFAAGCVPSVNDKTVDECSISLTSTNLEKEQMTINFEAQNGDVMANENLVVSFQNL